MSPVETYVNRTRSGVVFSVLTLLCIFPVFALNALLESTFGPRPGTIAVLFVLALAAAFYAFYVTEVKLVIDGAHVRLSEQDIAFGLRRANRILWELPVSELTAVQEITTRTPSSRGGWGYSTVLHFPGDRKLTDQAFGWKTVPTSEYNRLAAALRTRLGDRFTAEERT